MFPLNDKDYRIAQQVQREMRQQASEDGLARSIHETKSSGGFVAHHRRLMKGLAVLVVVLAIFAGVKQAFAQGSDRVRADAGGPVEPLAEAMRAYREGHYCLNHGEYVQAVDWLTQAVQGIPAEVMVATPDYQDMFWTLGEAQEAAGYISDAYLSYYTWLTLAGEDAADWTVVKVQEMGAQFGALLIEDTRS